MSLLSVQARVDNQSGPVTPALLAIDAGSDATLYFDFVTKQPRPRSFTYCQLTAVDLCLPLDEPTPRRLVSACFLAGELQCLPPLIHLTDLDGIDFLLDADAPSDIYGVRVSIPASATASGCQHHRELGYTLQAVDADGRTLILASGLLVVKIT